MRTIVRGLCIALLSVGGLYASTNGSISGLVTDSSGAVVTGAAVTAINTQTGIKSTTRTDARGFFSFPSLSIGTYDLDIQEAGFKSFRRTGLVLDANSDLRADATLPVGTIAEKIEVQSDALQVETQSTQLGEVISGTKITAVPLNGRSFTDLLALQPGVSPYTASDTGTPGIGDRGPSGGLNEGNESVNGQRETSNGFMVNGSSVEEGKNNGASIIPNLDSIDEFRIITNNFDAEYGNYSGGQVNVATKSGTNGYHGDAFEFLRNTDLDARNYFANARGVFIQNIFGGTFGGPIKRDKTFFFVDYQGTRQIQATTQVQNLPSAADRTGDLSDEAASLSGVVDGPAFATILSNRLGYAVTAGENYYTPGCTVGSCVFPNAQIPTTAWSPVASHILPLIPLPNASGNGFNYSSSANPNQLQDDKGGLRLDESTHWGMLSAYYYLDNYSSTSAFPGGGATIPGFSAGNLGRAQLLTLGDTKTISPTSLNEFRFSYVRDTSYLGAPQGGLGTSLASLGFVAGFSPTTGGIAPIEPALQGVPSISLNNFTLGVPSDTVRQFNNSFQWLDNFSKVVGTHSFKFGGQFHYDQINERNYYGEDGQFSFYGGETGLDFADLLIGAPDSFIQASKQILDSRTKYMGLFFQDSWRATPNLTLNYGLRWEFSQPWYDTTGKIETIIPGEQSVLFPNAPKGWVVPGDPGVPKTLAPTKYDAFSPRLGIAYSPSFDHGILGKLLGGAGKTSIRAGFGVYFTAVEDQGQFLEVGDPPFGLFYVSPVSPLLEAPYIDRATGNSEGQRFPFQFPPTNVSASHPDSSFNWASVEPISSGFVYDSKNRLPYSEHYEFSFQRELRTNLVLSASYVGNQGHKLITSLEANPVNAKLCAFLNNPNNVMPNTPTCGQFSEDPQGGFTAINGTTYPSLRPLGPNFASNPYEDGIANSSYNSLQLSLKHEGQYSNFLFGYTYSKCIDNASGLQDSTNPFNPALSRGLCNFDLTHNFVASYGVALPFDHWTGASGFSKAVAGGWSLSGITTFATGLPVSLSESDDNSLTGITSAPVDTPQFLGGPVLNNTNPRSGQPYFNPSAFGLEPLGQIGDARRRFFHGPGINNFNMALLKSTKFAESKELEFRVEAFNLFNHTQFGGPNGGINADSTFTGPNNVPQANSGSFGYVTTARDPRIMQVALKLLF
jgi:hypothetical protein